MKRLLLIAITIIAIIGCNKHLDNDIHPVEKQQYDSLVEANISLMIKYDSIVTDNEYRIDTLTNWYKVHNSIIDSLQEELTIANYKLERVREYNRIAAQGNNITFLRGWINRVLN